MQEINKKGYVYLIHSENMNHFYIGSTSNFKARFKHHSFQMRKGNHHSERLQKTFNKYGFDYFKFTVISEFNTREESELVEQELLDKYYKEDGCLNCSSIAIMAAQCPDVIAKRNETLKSEVHRNSASLKNKEWYLNNPEAAKIMHDKSAKTCGLPEVRRANSERQKKVNSTQEKKEAFSLRMKNYIACGGKTRAKQVKRIDSKGNEVIFKSAREAQLNTPSSDFRGISACCTKLRNAKSHAGFTWCFI